MISSGLRRSSFLPSFSSSSAKPVMLPTCSRRRRSNDTRPASSCSRMVLRNLESSSPIFFWTRRSSSPLSKASSAAGCTPTLPSMNSARSKPTSKSGTLRRRDRNRACPMSASTRPTRVFVWGRASTSISPPTSCSGSRPRYTRPRVPSTVTSRPSRA